MNTRRRRRRMIYMASAQISRRRHADGLIGKSDAATVLIYVYLLR